MLFIATSFNFQFNFEQHVILLIHLRIYLIIDIHQFFPSFEIHNWIFSITNSSNSILDMVLVGLISLYGTIYEYSHVFVYRLIDGARCQWYIVIHKHYLYKLNKYISNGYCLILFVHCLLWLSNGVFFSTPWIVSKWLT